MLIEHKFIIAIYYAFAIVYFTEILLDNHSTDSHQVLPTKDSDDFDPA